MLLHPTETNSQVPTYTSGSTPIGVSYEPFTWEWPEAATPSQIKANTTPDEDVRLLCNCYAYTKEVYPELPTTSVIKNNLTVAGEVAVFYYPSSGVYHYAVVVDSDEGTITIDETNFRHCEFGRRVINKDYPYLIGYYRV